jgi:hypothetical protein
MLAATPPALKKPTGPASGFALPEFGMGEMRGLNQDYLSPQANGWRLIMTPFIAFGVLINISIIKLRQLRIIVKDERGLAAR